MATLLTDPTYDFIEGRKYITWTGSKPSYGGAGDAFKIDDAPRFCTMTLFEMENASGSETIDPAVYIADPNVGTPNPVVENQTADVLLRNQTRVTITTVGGELWVDAKPAGGTPTVNVTITVVEGH